MRCIGREGWESRIKPFSLLPGPQKGRRYAHLGLAILLGMSGISGLLYPGAVRATISNFELRDYYQQARDKLRQGQLRSFRQLAAKLDDYALRPYLDYYYLRNRLSTATSKEVLAFAAANADLPITPLLYKRWLAELGKKRQWQTLRDNYRPSTDVRVRCYHLRSMYATGAQQQALDETTEIWLQPISQPKACDPLFEVWRKTPRFTQDVVWQRFEAAILANERTLARYLVRFLTGANRKAADAFYTVHAHPTRITRTRQYKTDNTRFRSLIAHGLIRLATKEPDKAEKAWQSYRASHDFEPYTRQRINASIAVNQAMAGRFPTPQERAALTTPGVIEDLATAAIEAQNWTQASIWIERLPSDIKSKLKWQYWLARAFVETGNEVNQAEMMYRNVARHRHYYGFLAARQLGIPGRMNGAVGRASSVELAHIRRIPGLRRAIELFAVGDDLNGRREWYKVLTTLAQEDQILAAELAQQLGLIAMAIRTANIAEATDHLHLRFPLAYEPQFRRASNVAALPLPLLIAIARQESALQANARSPAGALGLMQLMPSTARIVARRARKPAPSTNQLFDPGTNIGLGSYHLAWLMERYEGQSPLAIAAYNAGEHRVDRWIKEAEGMPMDVWVEQIPFRETRNYVKNVLAFRHVYGEKLAMPAPLLSANEQVVRLPR